MRKGHRPRPALAKRYPVHVTLKVLSGTPYLRRGVCFKAIRHAFVLGKDKFGFRLAHFSVQGNHMHLICEADDKVALTRGMQGLSIRIARYLNTRLGRKGRLFAERYHARILETPTEVRNALVYVINNARHHQPQRERARDWVDPFSSAAWFDGWRLPPGEVWARPQEDVPVVVPATWLLKKGWRFRGLIALCEAPA